MKTATIKLGDKNYQAAHLTVAETASVARAMAEMERATAAEDFERVTAALKAMRRVVFNALQKTHSQITAEELKAAAPSDVMMAVGELMLRSNMAAAS